MQAQVQKQDWHIANWGLLGWLETGIKGIGILFGFVAFLGSLSALTWRVGDNPRLAALIVIAIMTLFYVGGIIRRVGQREVISLVFAILAFLGHLALLVALLRMPESTTLPILFGLCFVIGEIIKQRFLQTTGYTEGGLATGAMVNFSRGVMGVYLLFVVFMII